MISTIRRYLADWTRQTIVSSTKEDFEIVTELRIPEKELLFDDA
jgi:hypothetical protein